MAAYDDFAWFYDRYWNEEFHSLAFPILERVWLARLPARSEILDVCCGTGYLAGLLLGRGHSVTGIDCSPVMIEYARENQPAGRFQVADVTSFHLPGAFDAAVSTFDSINHILSVKELQAAFRRVAAALAAGGLFAFDVLLEDADQSNWGQSFALVRDDHVLTITGIEFRFSHPQGSLYNHHVSTDRGRLAALGCHHLRAVLHRQGSLRRARAGRVRRDSLL